MMSFLLKVTNSAMDGLIASLSSAVQAEVTAVCLGGGRGGLSTRLFRRPVLSRINLNETFKHWKRTQSLQERPMRMMDHPADKPIIVLNPLFLCLLLVSPPSDSNLLPQVHSVSRSTRNSNMSADFLQILLGKLIHISILLLPCVTILCYF